MNEEIIDKLGLTIYPLGEIGMNRQLADQLGEAIQDGVLQRGDWLPSETSLSEHLKISRDVVRRAYNILRKTNYIEPQGKKGWMIIYSVK